MERDEIYLRDVWRILLREWRWFAAVFVLTLLCTFAATHLLKPQWEANAWIQIGQVGVVPEGQDPKVEPLQRVLERLKLVPFENEVLKSAGFSPDAPQSRLYRDSLKLEPMPYAGPLIRLSVRADSPQLARRLAEATVARLDAIHLQAEAGPLADARVRLAQVRNDLRDALAERDRLLQSARKATRQDAAANVALESMLLQGKQQEIRNLQQTRNDLLARLGPAYTYETSLMWPVYVPARPAFPNYALIWLIGVAVGISLGAFVAAARNAVQPARGVSGERIARRYA